MTLHVDTERLVSSAAQRSEPAECTWCNAWLAGEEQVGVMMMGAARAEQDTEAAAAMAAAAAPATVLVLLLVLVTEVEAMR